MTDENEVRVIRAILDDLDDDDDPPTHSIPVPTIQFPTVSGEDFVLELRMPRDSIQDFDRYLAGHEGFKIRIVPE